MNENPQPKDCLKCGNTRVIVHKRVDVDIGWVLGTRELPCYLCCPMEYREAIVNPNYKVKKEEVSNG
jgi:hypothetical protein